MSGGMSASTMAMISVGTQVVGSIQKGRQEKAYYDQQAAGAEVDAETARQLAAVEAVKIRKAGRKEAKTAVSNLAASGVDLTQGTALKIPQEIERATEEDAQMALLSGKYRAVRQIENAENLRAAGSNAQSSSMMSAAGSLMSFAGTASKNGWFSSAKGTT